MGCRMDWSSFGWHSWDMETLFLGNCLTPNILAILGSKLLMQVSAEKAFFCNALFGPLFSQFHHISSQMVMRFTNALHCENFLEFLHDCNVIFQENAFIIHTASNTLTVTIFMLHHQQIRVSFCGIETKLLEQHSSICEMSSGRF